MSNTLQHYGVLGMKWGHRNRSYEEAHTIPKGTTMYRTSPEKNEVNKGSTYVTFLKVDRDLYRGAYQDQIMSRAKDKGGKPYEHKYKLTEDLNIPSRQTLNSTVNGLMKDKTLRSKVLKAYAKNIAKKEEFEIAMNLDYNKSVDAFKKDLETAKQQRAKELFKAYIKQYGMMTPEEILLTSARTFGILPEIKNKVIVELKKKGYNAIIDEASVGGMGRAASIEGISPLIVFNSESSLSKQESTVISKATKKAATTRYVNWNNKINRG